MKRNLTCSLIFPNSPTPHIFMFSSSESNWEESALTCDVLVGKQLEKEGDWTGGTGSGPFSED